jgi:TRAP-type uncharacterized transport system substrate-binding protein
LRFYSLRHDDFAFDAMDFMKPILRRLFATTYVTGEPIDITPSAQKPEAEKTSQRSATMIVIAVILAAMFASAAGIYIFVRPTTLRIAVGPKDSDDARIIQTVAQTFARERGSVRLRVVVTDGAIQSASALDNNNADLAVVRGDLALPKDAQTVAILRKNVVVLWVPAPAQKSEPSKPSDKGAKDGAKKTPASEKASGKAAKPDTPAKPIEKIEDLAGRSVGIIGRTKGNLDLFNLILAQYGVASDKVKILQFPVSEAADAIRNAKADAFLAAGPVSSRVTLDAIAASSRFGVPQFLAIDAADAIAASRPIYEATEISEGAFGSAPLRPEEAVKTIGFAHYVVARKSLSEQTVTDFTRALFSARQSISSEISNAKIEAPDTDKDAAIPAHPGAAAYIDGDEKTFFDRYSDLLYWGLILLSGAGSVGAWFASYLKRDEANASINKRSRLLEIIRLARAAQSAEELDQLQDEADTILQATLDAYEDGAVSEGGLAAFSLALEQAHAAIADRRAMRMGYAPASAPSSMSASTPPQPA